MVSRVIACSGVLLMMTMLTGCTRFDLLNATVPTWGYDRTRDLAYGPLPRQKLDVYRPGDATTPASIVVFFYGGDWQNGEKGDYRFVGQALASRGFIAVLPDYRLYPAVTFPAFVEDGALAFKWVHDHANEIGGDDRHIYLMGHSAGAHIAALLTVDPHYLKNVGLDRSAIAATVGLSGPYDFVPPPGDEAALGMRPGDDRPADEAEPITFVDGREPPMLLAHGTADPVVAIDGAKAMALRIRERGGQVQTKFYDGVGHPGVVMSFAWLFRWIAPTLEDVTAYVHEMDALRDH